MRLRREHSDQLALQEELVLTLTSLLAPLTALSLAPRPPFSLKFLPTHLAQLTEMKDKEAMYLSDTNLTTFHKYCRATNQDSNLATHTLFGQAEDGSKTYKIVSMSHMPR